ncbi:ethanolamine utilization protein EutJ [Candidatus Hakubella thermalkaliphila]|uniref:Ethanolamine utilization protein EutJ n=1 Tax=Candidatus Hakubella thermalkaliphila TaxID=2754717 RepID=A0A6V8QF29_9ACTN|nr:ethanolamine utilization protein EutJ [Candidatus Hakubella thermalkaliphila]GFP35484.1 ethanolamine utilization protein EutJ [Candidatus Hakubella thermalkaliphila]GFP43345.1 ethanolamine utilization protein EutJ [Candidatus Hakubella thermalkaliphila]
MANYVKRGGLKIEMVMQQHFAEGRELTPDELLALVEQALKNPRKLKYKGELLVGVDLGTAYVVVVVLDSEMMPLAGAMRFAQVVRDGLVVDYTGAIRIVREMLTEIEERVGCELVYAATGYPPGVPLVEVQSTRHVVEATGLKVVAMLDEPTAANAVLKIRDGAVVDIGGGTTGIAILEEGEVVYVADEPTGGIHFSLVIAGAGNISLEEAEEIKVRPENQEALFPVVRPVMQKVASIIRRHVEGKGVKAIYLVGGTSSFQRIDRIIEEEVGIKTYRPSRPLFVTPLGIAMNCKIL